MSSSSESEFDDEQSSTRHTEIENIKNKVTLTSGGSSSLSKKYIIQKSREESESDHDSQDKNNESDSDNEKPKLPEELRTESFEHVMKIKEHGLSIYNEYLFGINPKIKSKKPSKNEYKRANKNRPREMSSKRPVPLLGNKNDESKQNIRDPRFDTKCGEYDSKKFKSNYEFINEIRENEIKDLKVKLKKENDESEINRIKFLIQRLENQNREERKRKLKESILKEETEKIKKSKEEGKKPHYSTKKELKTRELVKQFEELKSTGKLRKHLEKRRKKNASKDRKKFSFD